MGDEAVAATDTACSWLKLCYRMKQEHRVAITRKPQVKQDLFFFFPSRVEKTCLVHSCQDLVQCSEKALARHSSTLAWKIPWTEEPGRLQSMGSWRVGHDWMTSLSFFTFMHWRKKWQPTPVFLPGGSQGRGNLLAAAYGVAQTRLKRLSGSSTMLAVPGQSIKPWGGRPRR